MSVFHSKMERNQNVFVCAYSKNGCLFVKNCAHSMRCPKTFYESTKNKIVVASLDVCICK